MSGHLGGRARRHKAVPCAHIAAYYQAKWEEHKCIAFNFLRQGYAQWAKGGWIRSFNNLFGDDT